MSTIPVTINITIPETISGPVTVSGELDISGKINVSGILNVLVGDNGGSAAWTPASLSPKLWLKADAGVTEVAGAVSNWASQEGSGYNFAQATGANKPAYSATGFNTSYPGLTFTAASPSFVASTFTMAATTSLSVFVVLTYTASAADNGGAISVLANGQATDYQAPSFIIESKPGSGRGMELFIDAQRGDLDDTVGPSFNTPAAYGWICDGVNAKMYVGNVVLGSFGAFSSTVGAAGASYLAIGSRPWNGNTPSFDGTIAEIVITDTALGTTDRGLLQTYFAAKWGI